MGQAYAHDRSAGDYITGTSTVHAATINAVAGAITTEALTTAAAAIYTFTLTNSFIAATSNVLVSVSNGSNTTEGLCLLRVQPGAGTCDITIKNVNASALNGTIVIRFNVL